MRTEVTRSLLRTAAKATGHLPTTLGGTVIADAGAWEYVIDYATPAQRINLLVSLGPALLGATEGGRLRLAHIRDRPQDADDEPLVVGDPEALPIVRAALALVPTAVRYSLMRDVGFSCVGISSAAWTASSTLRDMAGRVKPIEIHLGPKVDVPLVLHELAHAWTKRYDEYSQAISVQGEQGLHALAAREGWADQAEKWIRVDESLADALALAWWYAAPESEGARLPA